MKRKSNDVQASPHQGLKIIYVVVYGRLVPFLMAHFWTSTKRQCIFEIWIYKCSPGASNRGRHPGQGPRDPAVPVPEIWDRDRDWDSFRNPGLGPGLKFKICGIWDWDRDWNLKNPGLLRVIFLENKLLVQPDVVSDSESHRRNFGSLAPPGGKKKIIFIFQNGVTHRRFSRFFNQSTHERNRHRLGMGWTNVHPADK